MERKVGLRAGQRPVGYHASREGLDELRDVQSDAARARTSKAAGFRKRLQALNAEDPTDEGDSEETADENERVTFHPSGPVSRPLKPGERWRLKG